ncbi:MAG: putative MAPEG superfamily protein [Bacteriovoracaceae bacterium]|jgi:uncharacterized MAPEG superfamily protein
MNIAVLCVFISFILPTICAGIAKMTGGFKMSHNAHPREFLASLEGRSARANAAQMNGWEAAPQFAAAIILAIQFNGRAEIIDCTAIIFVLSRILYTIAYIGNYARTRTSLFFVGTACTWFLFYLALSA